MTEQKELPKISVIIPCRNEEKYIADCLESILVSDYPRSHMEVLVFDGKSEDRTAEIVRHYGAKLPFIQLFENPRKTVPHAMNTGIEKATGDYIIRLDAHSQYPTNYFTQLIQWSQKLKADNVGAIWITDVKNKNIKSLSIKSVLSSPFGVGNAFFRTGAAEIKEVDTVPFGCYHKTVFEKYGRYNERLTRNQDIELNKRIKQNGGKIFLIPNINCTYYARETFHEIAHNNYRNGHWNILTVYITRSLNSLSLRHFIPLALVLSLIFPIIAGWLWDNILVWLSAAFFIIYQGFILMASAKLKNRENSFVYLWWSFMTLHFSYGVGSITGIFRIGKIFGK
ncbi:MAG: glycosyltransferase family 2 protein [Bacteroidetes bacterium]|nr:glycosyltransferase family 2 protein [Bacteroidota bacterium]